MEQVVTGVVKTPEFAMEYLQFGRGPGKLVILPGVSVQSVVQSAQAIAEAYQPLAEAFTVTLLERRQQVPERYPIREMARDTVAALDALGLDKVCLFGVSQGSMIAMEIAVRYPERVEKLALGSACACVPGNADGVLGRWMELARAGQAEELFLAFGEAVYPPAVFEQAKESLGQAAKTATREEMARFLVLLEGMKDFSLLEELGKIACPVLLLASEDDGVLGPEAARQIVERLEGREDFAWHLYRGYGHAAYDLAPDYKQRLLAFLA